MTTIACDGQSMAGDGLVTSGNAVFGKEAVKVHELKDGRLVGIAGNARCAAPFLEWIASADASVPDLDEEFEAIVLATDGTCKSYDHKCRAISEELPTATGSGREFALAAMDLGATPEEAVKIASGRDVTTGGKITVIHRPRKLKRVA